jgi:hypothetical protein
MANAVKSAIVKISELNGFKANQRVFAQDVEASPPQRYPGTIICVWSNGSADIKWDFDLPFEAERHLVRSGSVELHHLLRQPA